MLAERDLCTGCGTCAASCGRNSISMISDNEGFLYPVVDEGRCIRCGKCAEACPVIKNNNVLSLRKVYAVKNKDESVRMQSTSGGIFWELAKWILDENGVVCGAAYNSDFSVIHKMVENICEIPDIMGAKYAQSISSHLFNDIEERLKKGQKVLFSGTPCQTSGLKSYLKHSYDNLVLIDTVCHGVPSPTVWKYYLKTRHSIDAPKSQISKVNMRSKVSGWSKQNYSMQIDYSNGKKYIQKKNEDLYMLGFIMNLYLRPSCANCSFKGVERSSDLTLGDFWGVWDSLPEMDDDRGVSLLFVQTDKGHQIWDKIQSKFDFQSVDLDVALAGNPSVVKSAEPHNSREQFFDEFGRKPENVINTIRDCLYGKKPTLIKRISNKLKRIIH